MQHLQGRRQAAGHSSHDIWNRLLRAALARGGGGGWRAPGSERRTRQAAPARRLAGTPHRKFLCRVLRGFPEPTRRHRLWRRGGQRAAAARARQPSGECGARRGRAEHALRGGQTRGGQTWRAQSSERHAGGRASLRRTRATHSAASATRRAPRLTVCAPHQAESPHEGARLGLARRGGRKRDAARCAGAAAASRAGKATRRAHLGLTERALVGRRGGTARPPTRRSYALIAYLRTTHAASA